MDDTVNRLAKELAQAIRAAGGIIVAGRTRAPPAGVATAHGGVIGWRSAV